MGRKIQRQVDEIKHKSGIRIPIMFDPNSKALTFHATAGGKSFTEESADKLKRTVLAYLDDNAVLTWVPVIEIAETAPFVSRSQDFIGLELERYYLANTSDPKMMRKLKWDDFERTGMWDEKEQTDMGRITDSGEFWGFHLPLPGCLPHTSSGSQDKRLTYIAYDEAAWAGLNAIADGIGKLKGQLRTLLGTEEGRAKLTQVGASLLRLLPENTEPNEKETAKITEGTPKPKRASVRPAPQG